VTFRATEKRKQELQRVLRRLRRVFAVTDYPYEDPMMRETARHHGATLDDPKSQP
jgi:hypothetical protein